MTTNALPRSIINVDCLLDAVQALVSDCAHPAIRKIKNVDAFVNRCKLKIKLIVPQINQISFLLDLLVITFFFTQSLSDLLNNPQDVTSSGSDNTETG